MNSNVFFGVCADINTGFGFLALKCNLEHFLCFVQIYKWSNFDRGLAIPTSKSICCVETDECGWMHDGTENDEIHISNIPKLNNAIFISIRFASIPE